MALHGSMHPRDAANALPNACGRLLLPPQPGPMGSWRTRASRWAALTVTAAEKLGLGCESRRIKPARSRLRPRGAAPPTRVDGAWISATKHWHPTPALWAIL